MIKMGMNCPVPLQTILPADCFLFTLPIKKKCLRTSTPICLIESSGLVLSLHRGTQVESLQLSFLVFYINSSVCWFGVRSKFVILSAIQFISYSSFVTFNSWV